MQEQTNKIDTIPATCYDDTHRQSSIEETDHENIIPNIIDSGPITVKPSMWVVYPKTDR